MLEFLFGIMFMNEKENGREEWGKKKKKKKKKAVEEGGGLEG